MMKILFSLTVFMSVFFTAPVYAQGDHKSPQLISIERHHPLKRLHQSEFIADPSEQDADYRKSFTFRYTFSEDVVNFDLENKHLIGNGTANSAVAQLGQPKTTLVQISPSVYDLTIETVPQDGTLSYEIQTSGSPKIMDLAGNELEFNPDVVQEFYEMNVVPQITFDTQGAQDNIGKDISVAVQDDGSLGPSSIAVNSNFSTASLGSVTCKSNNALSVDCSMPLLSTGAVTLDITQQSGNVTQHTQSIKAPLYRFWSQEYKHHFFTPSAAERDAILENDKNWDYEAVAYNVELGQRVGTMPVYRFWSEELNGHFYTMSLAEKEFLEVSDPNWTYEGIGYYAFASAGTNMKPVYRFYSAMFNGHFYTASEDERENLIQNDNNWTFEGIAWFYENT